MFKTIKVNVISNKSTCSEEFEISCLCPHCGTSIHPVIISSYSVGELGDEVYTSDAFVVNLCPCCEQPFLSVHQFDEKNDNFKLVKTFPSNQSAKPSFSSYIQNLSPNFLKIYTESMQAETESLLSICGMGYRKSLEFLIKDYAIYLYPKQVKEISNKSLSSCISDYIESPRIKNLAKASAWIGNDETHYTRKHEDYNIEHLKMFITALVTFIDADLAASNATKLINSK